MGCYHYEDEEYSKAMECFLKSAVLSKSQNRIGIMYSNGEGVSKDEKKPMEWFLKAAESNNSAAQYNIGVFYYAGKGGTTDYSKAMEWFIKAAENNFPSAQIKMGVCFEKGYGVAKDYSKALEWYLKAANNNLDPECAMIELKIANLYLRGGHGVEQDEKKAIVLVAKSFNCNDFKLIENPCTQFAIEHLVPYESPKMIMEDEMDQQVVIIRFKERDFTILGKYLHSSKYLSTMLNSNWIDFNEKEDNQIVLDLQSIQNDIFQEETPNLIQIFETYLNYLTSESNEIPTDIDMKIKLIELTSYLCDDKCILRILQRESLLMRFHILQKIDRIEPYHVAVASYFTSNSSSLYTDLSGNIMEYLLNECEMSSLAKKNMLDVFEKKYKVSKLYPF